MKKLKNLIILFFVILFSNFAYSDECDFDYNIGENTTNLISNYDYDESSMGATHKFSLPGIQVALVHVCPNEGIDHGLLNILMFGNEIAGFYLEIGSYKEENKDLPLLNYLKENYSNYFKFDSLDWVGVTASWTTLKNEIFYYYKEDRDDFAEEQLLITKIKYDKYIMNMNDIEASIYNE